MVGIVSPSLVPEAGSVRQAMNDDREHVISVVLKHEEWKEFVALQPEPVIWLRERIQETIASRRPVPAKATTPVRMA
ncbi:MAG: hypothetical protein ACT4QD_22805 [Acidobacteriota bacterium]